MTFQPPKPPDGCVDAEEHERRLTLLADKLEAATLDLLAQSGNGIMMSRAKEMSLSAIRARRAAAELAIKRLEVSHLDWLIDQQRRLAGVQSANGNRPRLNLPKKRTA